MSLWTSPKIETFCQDELEELVLISACSFHGCACHTKW